MSIVTPQAVRNEVLAIWEAHDPEKCLSIDVAMKKFVGKEALMLKAVKKKCCQGAGCTIDHVATLARSTRESSQSGFQTPSDTVASRSATQSDASPTPASRPSSWPSAVQSAVSSPTVQSYEETPSLSRTSSTPMQSTGATRQSTNVSFRAPSGRQSTVYTEVIGRNESATSTITSASATPAATQNSGNASAPSIRSESSTQPSCSGSAISNGFPCSRALSDGSHVLNASVTSHTSSTVKSSTTQPSRNERTISNGTSLSATPAASRKSHNASVASFRSGDQSVLSISNDDIWRRIHRLRSSKDPSELLYLMLKFIEENVDDSVKLWKLMEQIETAEEQAKPQWAELSNIQGGHQRGYASLEFSNSVDLPGTPTERNGGSAVLETPKLPSQGTAEDFTAVEGAISATPKTPMLEPHSSVESSNHAHEIAMTGDAATAIRTLAARQLEAEGRVEQKLDKILDVAVSQQQVTMALLTNCTSIQSTVGSLCEKQLLNSSTNSSYIPSAFDGRFHKGEGSRLSSFRSDRAMGSTPRGESTSEWPSYHHKEESRAKSPLRKVLFTPAAGVKQGVDLSGTRDSSMAGAGSTTMALDGLRHRLRHLQRQKMLDEN